VNMNSLAMQSQAPVSQISTAIGGGFGSGFGSGFVGHPFLH